MAEFSNTTRQRKPNTKIDDDLVNQADDKKERKVTRSSAVIVLKLFALIIGVFSLYIIITPCPVTPVPMIKNDPLPYFDGVMLPNDKLQKTTKIGDGELSGPESIQVDSYGNIYTGLHNGQIVKIEKSTGAIIELARTGENLPECGRKDLEEQCGRPLGLHLDKTEENLLICDSYMGLLKLHLKTRVLSYLIPASVGINGVPFKFLNSLASASDNKVYFTDSSWKWSRKDFPYIMIEGGGRGRLLSFDMNTNETDVLLDGLFFPNGIALSSDEDFLVVTETSHTRVIRIWIKGDKRGMYDVFADNLPGFPDNIRNAKNGGYWVGFASKREWPFSFLDAIGPYPRIKSVLAKVIPKHLFERFVKTYGLIVKLDSNGDIVESYHDTSGKVISHISEAYEVEGVLYLGSYRNKFLGKLTLDE